jgi:signal transduction histidine kinase
MAGLNLRMKAFLIAGAFTIVVVGGALYFYSTLQDSTTEVIATNRIMTEAAVQELNRAGGPLIDSLWRHSILRQSAWTKVDERRVDSLLSAVTAAELSPFPGMEGGYYFLTGDQFFGYAFPTSPPPKPAFGPPPRSYHIIHDQSQRSVRTGQRIVELHQFDPATFPLVTEPITVDGRPIGAVWARIHIERLLPTVRLTSVLIVAALLSLVGFLVVIGIAWRLRNRTEEIRIGLDTLQRDTAFRFPQRGGVFGTIMHSINDMVAARTNDQQLRAQMERDLHQQDKMASLGKLISRVAHEVKTPLAVIKTRIQMWQRSLRRHGGARKGDGVISNESMTMVVREIDRLSDLVKRLLLFSRPVGGKQAPTDIRLVINQTLGIILPAARARHVRVHTDFDGTLPPLLVDGQALEQVFLNICANALDAMPRGGHIQISTSAAAAEGMAIVAFADDGTGISPEVLPRIFDPFFTTKPNGAGLGLSIAYEITRGHGGRIEFQNRNGHGTVCRVILPLQPQDS